MTTFLFLAFGYVVLVATCGVWGLLAAVIHIAILVGSTALAPRRARRC